MDQTNKTPQNNVSGRKSENQDDENPPLQDQNKENKLLSDRFEELHDALETLYIKNNASGRRLFLKAWPKLAARLFGPDLVSFDTEGGGEADVRAILEEEAEERRFEFLQLAETLEERSMDKGSLQKDYVQEVIDTWSRDLALLLYDPQIIERVLSAPVKSGQVKNEDGAASSPAPSKPEAPPPDEEPPEAEPPETAG